MATRRGRQTANGFRQVLLLWVVLCAGPAAEACLLPESSVHPPATGGCSNPKCGCRHEPGAPCSCPCCSAGREGTGGETPVTCSCHAGQGADDRSPVMITLSLDPQQTAGIVVSSLPVPGARDGWLEKRPLAAKDRPHRPPDPPPRPAS